MSVGPVQKVVALAFDGLDPKIVRRLLAAGELPNFARLADKTPLHEIGTTCPAQTPVAFATFSTGLNPGGHGVFDFLRRNPATYLPDHSLNRYEQASRFLPPKVINLRRGATLWQQLAKADLPSAILRVPCSYPPDEMRGSMLSGLGVPDIRGGLGTPTFYSTAADLVCGHDERVMRLVFQGDTSATHIIGPRHPKTRQDCLFDIRVQLGVRGDACAIQIQSAGSPGKLDVAVGQWSPWLKVKFKLGLLMSVPGMVRFYLVRTEPEVELYASAVNFDPDAPPYPISSPPEYAKQLAAALGPFYTTGMVEEHTGLNNGRINEFAFLEQCEQVWRERERMLHYELDRQRQGLVFCLFDTSDRIQHMLWRHTEPDHPANRIFLNLGGRERQGIVSPDEVHQVEQQIIEGLSGLKDAATGDVGVRSVMRRSEVYTGACAAESPDLMVNCNAGYRIAWTSARGCVAGTQFENNDKRWSGDHIIDPALAPGMLLMNRSFMPRKCDLRDLAPTILAALGAPPAEAMEGQSLL